MIRLLSWLVACLMSCVMAVWPPTFASASGIACTAVRTRRTVASAAELSGASRKVAVRYARPFFT